MQNVLTQSWFKPVVVVKSVALATWRDENGKSQEVQIELSLEQLDAGATAVRHSGYHWQDNLVEAELVSGSGKDERAVGFIPEGGDVDLAVLNLEEHYMRNVAISDFLEKVTVDGTPVVATPANYHYRDLAIRRAVLTLVVRHLLAQTWQHTHTA